ncbi:MAE_28990/MAE_18760 family HEPN-like nuclease [Pseudomonas mandelii]|uniref:MAE_28990/MAE_18760 family HEPN-like nuclease n=1 Tax=Pseudomonas mandelii TaxID=75612 RepID=UPI003C753F51
MEALDRALSTATLQIEEAQATARIWQTYSDILVSKSGFLYPVFTNEPEKTLYHNAMADKSTDASALYRGLLIQLNGIFEGYIRLLAGAVLDFKRTKVVSYADLEDTLRIEHVVSSAKILSHLKSGSVNGIRHDFETTKTNLGKCLTDAKDFKLNKEAFTLLMGNCTPGRLESLFESLGLPEPFQDKLAESKPLQRWADDKHKRRLASHVKEHLTFQIDTRNDIVHGNITKALTHQDFQNASSYFLALIQALNELVKDGLAEVEA